MAIVFWDMKGVLLVEIQEHGRILNASSYCNLERLKSAIRTKCKGLLTQGVILLHDYTRSQTACLTLETVEQLGLKVLPHPPYSLDLAPLEPGCSHPIDTSYMKVISRQVLPSNRQKPKTKYITCAAKTRKNPLRWLALANSY